VNRLNPEYAYNNFEGQSEPLATTIYYYLKNKADKEVKISIYKGNVLVNEIKGTNEAGINKVLWDWTSRKERSEESKKRVQEMLKRYAEYGYTPRGRNLDVNYEYLPAPAGDYLVVLKVGDKSFSQTARLLLDSWSD